MTLNKISDLEGRRPVCAVVNALDSPYVDTAFARDDLLLREPRQIGDQDHPDRVSLAIDERAGITDFLRTVLRDHLKAAPGLSAVEAAHGQCIDMAGVAKRVSAPFED